MPLCDLSVFQDSIFFGEPQSSHSEELRTTGRRSSPSLCEYKSLLTLAQRLSQYVHEGPALASGLSNVSGQPAKDHSLQLRKASRLGSQAYPLSFHGGALKSLQDWIVLACMLGRRWAKRRQMYTSLHFEKQAERKSQAQRDPRRVATEETDQQSLAVQDRVVGRQGRRGRCWGTCRRLPEPERRVRDVHAKEGSERQTDTV